MKAFENICIPFLSPTAAIPMQYTYPLPSFHSQNDADENLGIVLKINKSRIRLMLLILSSYIDEDSID